MEEKKLLNKVNFFGFFVHKKYSRSFKNVKVEPLMDYFNDVLTTFWGLKRDSSVAVYAGSMVSDFKKNILNIYICLSEDKQRSYGFVTT